MRVRVGRVAFLAVVSFLSGCGGGGGKSRSISIVTPEGTAYTNATIAIEIEKKGSGTVTLYDGAAPLAELYDPPYVYQWDTTLAVEGAHVITAALGSRVSDPVTIVVDRTPPEVAERAPLHGESDAPSDGVIIVRFTEAIAPASAAPGVVAVESEGVTLPASPVLLGDTLVVTPASLLPSPSLVRVTLSPAGGAKLADLAGNELEEDEWTFRVPLWQRLGGRVDQDPEKPSYNPNVEVDSLGRAVVAFGQADGDIYQYPVSSAYNIYVRRWDGNSWESLGGTLNLNPAANALTPVLAIDDQDRPVVSFFEEETAGGGPRNVYVRRWNGASWDTLGGGPLDLTLAHNSMQASVAIAADGEPIVSFWVADTAVLHVMRFNGTTWMEYGTGISSVANEWYVNALTTDVSGDPVLAYRDTAGDLRVMRWSGSGWISVGGILDVVAAHTQVGGPAIVVDENDDPIVAFHESDGLAAGGRENVYVKRWDSAGGDWEPLGEALDYDTKTRAWYPDLALDADGVTPYVAWSEYDDPSYEAYIARWTGSHWAPHGPALRRVTGSVNIPELAVDPLSGRLVATWNDFSTPDYSQADVYVARFSGTTSPKGLTRVEVSDLCLGSFDVAPPATLSATKCFSGNDASVPTGGLVPYDLNSPLWSDAALKRRWLALPPGGTIGWTASGPWSFPDGTMFFKEFAFERVKNDPATRFPVEMRILVKRDATTIEGYSYKWRDDGTEADLLADAPSTADYAVVDELGNPVTMTHTFPSRAQCGSCHLQNAGFFLGPQTVQLNRPLDYGETMDNQLRTLDEAGYFGTSLPSGQSDPGSLAHAPRTRDFSQPLLSRAKSYMVGNCAQCHRAGGVTLALMEWETPLSAMALCDDIVPMDAANSFLFQRVQSVPGDTPSPMPPLARSLQDPTALSVIGDWINGMAACP